MSDFVSLSCPSCGGKLEITKDLYRFACAYCGTEHMVQRGGGVVALIPVIEQLGRIGASSDKTASELAIVRLRQEIPQLEERYRFGTSHARRYLWQCSVYLADTKEEGELGARLLGALVDSEGGKGSSERARGDRCRTLSASDCTALLRICDSLGPEWQGGRRRTALEKIKKTLYSIIEAETELAELIARKRAGLAHHLEVVSGQAENG
jgi:DNA-directed RNA polymerase subunit RPC12/RpoP